MIIAIAASENNLKSNIDQHFGRCGWFCLFDSETKNIGFIENPAGSNHDMSGCDTAKFLIGKSVRMVIAGRFGARVIEIFKSAEVQMVIPLGNQTILKIIESVR